MVVGEGEGKGRIGRLGLADANSHREWIKQQGPPVEHGEQSSPSCDKPRWKRIWKAYILGCGAEISNTVNQLYFNKA